MTIDNNELREMDREFLWHPYTKHSSIKELPLPIIEKGEGVYLVDIEGRRYLDAISSWWSCNLGHGHPELIASIRNQAETLDHSIIGNLSHPTVIKLSKKLCNLFADNARHVLYGSDGASAVEAALKISIQYWYNVEKSQKCRFAYLSGDYHGDTLGTIYVGFVESFHRQFAKSVIPSFQAEAPFCGKCRFGKTEDTCSLECFSSMEDIITGNHEELAAVIVEPLCQGASGMRMYSPRYLTKLHEICAAFNILLIVDEIAMGYGRTGKMFAHQHAEIDPDIVCIGKGISGGTLPISATIVKNRIFDTFTDKPVDNTFYHGHTFAGNPIASAVALKVLEIYERDSIVEKAEHLGKILKEEMVRFEDLPTVSNVRCLGMIGAVELEEGNVSFESKDISRIDAIRTYLLEHNILMRPLGNVFYLMMPLVVSEDLLKETVEVFYEAVKSIK
jgi:adenosylmethionine-8-amino-7-oxononanoate aminotransferase